MVDLRPNQLPPASEVKTTDKLVIDQGTAGVNSVSPNVLFEVFAPVASQEDAEVGTDNTKRMTPLRTKQAITSEIGVTLASASQGAKADSAVQTVNGKSGNAVVLVKADVGLGNIDNTSDANKPISSASQAALDLKANNSIVISSGAGMSGGGDLTGNREIALSMQSVASLAKADTSVQPARTITAGAGLTGGGDLSANRTVALNAASIASLAKADTAVQPASLAAVATSGAYNDLTGRPTLGTMAAKNNVAISDIAATGTPSIGTFLRGDGTWGTVAGAGTVTSVAMTVPTGLTVTGSPITGAGTLGVTYTAGYQGYTTAEATKVSNLQSAAYELSTAFATAAQGSKADTAVQPAGLTKAAVGLGNVDNTSDANKPISTATQTALNGKLGTAEQAADSAKLGNETAAQWQSKIDAAGNWPGVYNGTTVLETNFPIGSYVLVVSANAPPNLNSTVTVRNQTVASYSYVTTGGGAILSGVWRVRGYITSAGFLAQRVEQ